MKVTKIVATVAGVFFFLAPLLAQPTESTDRIPPESKQIVTRSELVTDLDRVLSQWEENMSTYATKGELSELRTLIMQLQAELGDLGGREGSLQDTVDGLEQRVEHTRRPGF